MVIPIRMGWRDFLFIHWPIEAELVAPLIPDQLELDLFDGRAWVSVIPFVNVNLRPIGVPRALGVTLPELNVRTYVRYQDTPGIYFFSLDADGLGSVIAARLMHHLPYYFAATELNRHDGRISFTSRRRHRGARSARFEAQYWPTGKPFRAPDRERERFLFERYRFFTDDTQGRIRHTEVEHESWTVYPAQADTEVDTMLSATGLPVPKEDPIYQFSPGMDVQASPSRIYRQP